MYENDGALSKRLTRGKINFWGKHETCPVGGLRFSDAADV